MFIYACPVRDRGNKQTNKKMLTIYHKIYERVRPEVGKVSD